MDHLPPPTELEVRPEEAEQVFNYWLQTFYEFLKAVTAAAEDAETVNKLVLLADFFYSSDLCVYF